MSQTTDLEDRYGAAPPWQRPVLVGVCIVVVGSFLGWLGWVLWEQSTPAVTSKLVSFKVVDEHTATATVQVDLADGDVRATCTVRAYAEDHNVVGELAFTPEDGRNQPQVRTERAATSVELVGCTAPGQKRPR